jgi:hypothetical protein
VERKNHGKPKLFACNEGFTRFWRYAMTKDLNQGICKRQRCKKPFKKRRKDQAFCSSLCRYRFWNDQKGKGRKNREKEPMAGQE